MVTIIMVNVVQIAKGFLLLIIEQPDPHWMPKHSEFTLLLEDHSV